MPGGDGVVVQMSGADFGILAVNLRKVDPRLRREMSKEIRRLTKPLIADLREAVMDTSSSSSGFGSGGYGSMARAVHVLERRRNGISERQKNSALARSGLRVSIAYAIRQYQFERGSSAGVVVWVNGSNLPPDQRNLPRHMNDGEWRHPVMGNRDVWVTQYVSPSGWFTATARRKHPDIQENFNDVMQRYAAILAARLEAAAN